MRRGAAEAFNRDRFAARVEADASDWDAKTTYHFMVSAVAPRPIAWVTTVDPASGVVNAAPFSWFQSVCADPPMVMLAIGHKEVADQTAAKTEDKTGTADDLETADGTTAGNAGQEAAIVPKDTLRNIEATGQFVVNVATADAAETLVQTSAPYPADVSEADATGLALVPSLRVAPPRIATSPVHLECRLVETKRLGGAGGTTLVLGEVIHFGADDGVLDARGNVDAEKVPFLARLGGRDYTEVRRLRQIARPRLP